MKTRVDVIREGLGCVKSSARDSVETRGLKTRVEVIREGLGCVKSSARDSIEKFENGVFETRGHPRGIRLRSHPRGIQLRREV